MPGTCALNKPYLEVRFNLNPRLMADEAFSHEPLF